jgi:hypothetical protein
MRNMPNRKAVRVDENEKDIPLVIPCPGGEWPVVVVLIVK